MVRILLLCFFSFVIVFCSNSSLKRGQLSGIAEDSCKLYNQEFSVETATFKEFKEPLSDFFNSENRFDLLFIKMKGGNHSESEMKRWFIKDEIAYKIAWTQGKRQMDLINVGTEKIVELANTIESGDYMQICPYSTNNDSYLILIKSNSVLKFKYTSTDKDYQGLSLTERNKISNVVNLLSYLNSI